MTKLVLPPIQLVRPPFSLHSDVPEVAGLGQPIDVNVRLTNHTTDIQPVRITITKTSDFVIEGKYRISLSSGDL